MSRTARGKSLQHEGHGLQQDIRALGARQPAHEENHRIRAQAHVVPALPAQSFAFRGPMWPEPFEVHARVQGTELGTCLRVLVRNAPGKEVAHRVDGAGPSDGGRGCVRTDLAGREHIVVHAKRNAAAGRSFANAQKPRRPVEHVDQIEPFRKQRRRRRVPSSLRRKERAGASTARPPALRLRAGLLSSVQMTVVSCTLLK